MRLLFESGSPAVGFGRRSRVADLLHVGGVHNALPVFLLHRGGVHGAERVDVGFTAAAARHAEARARFGQFVHPERDAAHAEFELPRDNARCDFHVFGTLQLCGLVVMRIYGVERLWYTRSRSFPAGFGLLGVPTTRTLRGLSRTRFDRRKPGFRLTRSQRPNENRDARSRSFDPARLTRYTEETRPREMLVKTNGKTTPRGTASASEKLQQFLVNMLYLPPKIRIDFSVF